MVRAIFGFFAFGTILALATTIAVTTVTYLLVGGVLALLLRRR